MNTQVPEEMTPSRVSVWDANELDKGIYDVLKAQVQTVISYLPAGLITRFEPEINAIIKSALWMLSVEKTFATFGQRMLHLKYDKHTPIGRLRLLGILKIGSAYIKDRLSSILNWLNCSDVGSTRIEMALNILNIISFVFFLRGGGPMTFLERLLRLNPVSTLRPSDRSVGYSFMIRELLWHGLIELLMLVLPFLNYHSMKRIIRKIMGGAKPKKLQSHQYILTKDTRCPVCELFPILPYVIGCPHIFCYYCLGAHRLADPDFECPTCGFVAPPSTLMTEVKPAAYDVM
ncbi:peroxisome biogenesis factor 2 isoform X2 [Cimex lectularius]|uniref:RING-type E3 ubiquitin transferase (cysteine targeting) n=1 Tax=Cimex lectularius TaxID=79782 RepID=A0A8I6S6Y8_CIMLE|nr:peroxisome biogenesis factor 2 isoform X2 [Cimex lectularius]